MALRGQGALIFIDLNDGTGTLQVSFEKTTMQKKT